jgi:hypothetical protein
VRPKNDWQPVPLDVILYSKAGCGLCAEARADLLDLARTCPLTITEVDITSDPALYTAFFDRIPVIDIGPQRLYAPVDRAALEAALRRAASEGTV